MIPLNEGPGRSPAAVRVLLLPLLGRWPRESETVSCFRVFPHRAHVDDGRAVLLPAPVPNRACPLLEHQDAMLRVPCDHPHELPLVVEGNAPPLHPAVDPDNLHEEGSVVPQGQLAAEVVEQRVELPLEFPLDFRFHASLLSFLQRSNPFTEQEKGPRSLWSPPGCR